MAASSDATVLNDAAQSSAPDIGIPERPDAGKADAATEEADTATLIDVACPGGCDDQNPCTEGFCDIAGACPH